MSVDYKVRQIYNVVIKEVTETQESWKSVLRLAGQIYRYEFDNVLMVYAQKPHATLVADFDTWKKVGRYVKRGSKGIAIYPSRALQPYMRYVFDISDTGGKQSELTWNLDGDKLPEFMEYQVVHDFIDEQQKVIDKLREYKYACYSEIIEKHSTNTVSLGKVIEKVEQGWSPSPSERQSENGWKVLTLAAVKFGQFNQTEYKPFDGNKEKCEKLLLNIGDFLLTRSNTRDLVGQVCIVDETKEKMIFSDLIYRLSFYSEFILPEYALFAFQSPRMRQQISRDAHGSSSTMVKITHKDISNWEIVLPPLEEQELIVKELKSLDDLISKNIMNREGVIEKLMEYKKSLIYEVVTGKKEV